MKSITVNLPQDSYQIKIAANSLLDIGDRLKELNLGKKVLIISNPEIFNHYGNACVTSLENAGFND